jgi:hypothetical protein
MTTYFAAGRTILAAVATGEVLVLATAFATVVFHLSRVEVTGHI